MIFIFRTLLVFFTVISAYITYLFTSSLASSTGTLIALSAMGLCFDLLKCSLPNVAIVFIEARRFANAALCSLVCVLLVAFSLYASFSLIDQATQDKAKDNAVYQITLAQLEDAQREHVRLTKIKHYKEARELVAPKIERLTTELKSLTTASTSAGNQVTIVMNIILAVLLEISVVACHVAMRARYITQAQRSAIYSAKKSTTPQLPQGFLAIEQSAQPSASDSAPSANNKLSIAEWAQLLVLRGEADLSYKKLDTLYGLSAPKVRKIKQHIAEMQNNVLTLVK